MDFLICGADNERSNTISVPDEALALHAFQEERQNAIRPPSLHAKVKYEVSPWVWVWVWVEADLKNLRWKPPKENAMSSMMSGFVFDYEDIKKVCFFVCVRKGAPSDRVWRCLTRLSL